MTRRIAICLLAFLLTLTALPAWAAAPLPLPKYAFVVGGVEQPLTAKTGYIFRLGSKLMIPLEETARALGLAYTTNGEKTSITVTRADGVKVQFRTGTAWVRVGDKNKRLRIKTGRQDVELITADVKALTYLGAIFKHYKAGAKTKALGYPSGVLAVAVKGGDLTTIPEHGGAPSTDDTALPDAAKEAAQTATQIVTVRYKSGSNAKLRLFTKQDGVWTSQFDAVNAYVGKNGIGKTKEGDNKTPTGTFNLTTPFGILADPGAAMGGYTKVTKYHYWSGKSGSEYYNRLIDRRVDTDYTPGKNDEHLIDYTKAYNYCFFIDYNADGEAGLGSAIFLHCTSGSKSTAGCVAVDQSVMKSLLLTLKKGAKIVIYQ